MYTCKQSVDYKYFNGEMLIISAFLDDRFYVITIDFLNFLLLRTDNIPAVKYISR